MSGLWEGAGYAEELGHNSCVDAQAASPATDRQRYDGPFQVGKGAGDAARDGSQPWPASVVKTAGMVPH